MAVDSNLSASAISKPLLLDPTGDPRRNPLSISPPFLLRNVTCRIFPLQANMAVLNTFCDQYLNMDIPADIVHYAPALPYVYLIIMNYGSLSSSAIQAQNVGWFSQHEVAFSVPLQRWRKIGDRLAFQGWASVSPFIYVDDQFSLSTGREVYGWNKVTCRMDSDIPPWVTDPRAKLRQLGMSVVEFGSTYVGGVQSSQTLLQIDLDPPPTFTQFPPDPFNPWLPWWAAPTAVSNAASFAGSALDTALALRGRGYETNRSLGALREMVGAAGGMLKNLLPSFLPSGDGGQQDVDASLQDLPSLFADMLTLKQFRNPEEPRLACYQALVNGKMGVDRFNRAGLLCDVGLLRGDSSGGYSVRIPRLVSQPVVQTLGLQVSGWTDGDSPTTAAILKPVLPFWLDLDLYYGKGEVICSRAYGSATDEVGVSGDWVDEQPHNIAQPGAPPSILSTPGWSADGPAPPSTSAPPPPRPLYNTTLGAATQPIVGPFHFPDVTIQVYPLLADRQRIEQLLKNYLNDPLSVMYPFGAKTEQTSAETIQKGWRFEPLGSYVYMMVVVYGDELGQMWSDDNNIGGFFDREVTFCIPVKWYDAETGDLISVAMVEPVTYSNNGQAVATDREVNGYNSIVATIESPKDIWLEPGGPVAKRRFLHLATEVFPALNVGQKAYQGTVLEVDELDILASADAAGWGDVADVWERTFVDELKRKTYLASTTADTVSGVKALALEVLVNGEPFNRLVVKQYRDASDTTRACYQALVHATTTITSIYDIREIDPNVHVRMHRQPGNMLADLFGLRVKFEESRNGAVVDIIQPARPFWMRIGMREDLATVACFRASDEPMRIIHPWFGADQPASAGSPVGAGAPTPSPRRLAGQQPYFRQAGKSAVGPWLATRSDPSRKADTTSADLHLGLKMEAADWLRRSLITELLWKGMIFRSQTSDQQAAVENVIGLLSCANEVEFILKTEAIVPYCQSKTNDELSNYAEQIDSVFIRELKSTFDYTAIPDWSWIMVGIGFPQINMSPLVVAIQKIVAWSTAIMTRANSDLTEAALIYAHDEPAKLLEVNDRLGVLSAKLMLLPMAATTIIWANMTQNVRSILDDLSGYSLPDLAGPPNDPAKIAPVIERLGKLRPICEELERISVDWIEWIRWLRLTKAGAGHLIAELDEVQLVIDNILSSEWETRGQPRLSVENGKFFAAGLKPDEFIPNATGPNMEALAVTQGLQRWVDQQTGLLSDLWVAALPVAARNS